MNSVNPRIAVTLNMLVWGLGYIYLGKLFKGTATIFLFALTFGFYFVYVLIAGFSFNLLIEILIGYFLSSLWFGYDAYKIANRINERIDF